MGRIRVFGPSDSSTRWFGSVGQVQTDPLPLDQAARGAYLQPTAFPQSAEEH
jgi:hypothetical protein